jgi:hypothetical protein
MDVGKGEAGTTLDGSTDILRLVPCLFEIGPALPSPDESSQPKPDQPARHGASSVTLVPAFVSDGLHEPEGITDGAEDDVVPCLVALVDEVEADNASVREGGGAWEPRWIPDILRACCHTEIGAFETPVGPIIWLSLLWG